MLPLKKYKELNFDETPIKSSNEYMKYGFDRINQLLYNTDKYSTHLPRTIDFFDLDLSIKKLFSDGVMNLVIDGKSVPVIYMENERWGEFSKTWQLMDDDGNIPTPYITIRRVSKAQGTRIDKPRVAQNKKFIYKQIPILDDGQVIYLLYKMPEPIDVDLTYEIHLFTKFRVDVNEMDKLILKNYASTQLYVEINGKFFPTKLENLEETSTLQSIDEDKLIVGKYTITLMGALQYEDEFEITKTSRKPIFNINHY